LPELAGEWCDSPQNTDSPHFLEQLTKIQQVELYLQRKAKAEVTITTYIKALKQIAKRANLNNTAEVELAIANYKKENKEPASNRWKNQCVTAYKHYCKLFKITWEDPPHYKIDEKSIQPPSTEKCLMLMASAKGKLSLKIGISTETGLRPVEVTGEPKGLLVKDIHTDTQTITPTSAKGCNARPPIKISTELNIRLQTHIIRNSLKPNDRLFKELPKSYTSNFSKLRTRLAEKLKDPALASVRLYDLRHAYITKLLRKTQNAEIVRQKVGHKRLNTTQKYIHLTIDDNGEYIVESTTDQKRADELLAQGFNYCLTTPDGYMKFRKPK
jgi:integrase